MTECKEFHFKFALSAGYASKWNMMMAIAVLMWIPVVVLYFRSQKYSIEGITVGATKG